jgi:curved DNA-binding protein CbpA
MPSTKASLAHDDEYYRILGVTRDEGEDGLKRAYKRQALKWHPDKHHGADAVQAEERFKKVSEAYQILSERGGRSSTAVSRRRHSDGNKEVLFSKTYGWPGVNISFYWTGPPPTPEQTPTKSSSSSSSRRRKTAPAAPASPQAEKDFKAAKDEKVAAEQQASAEIRSEQSEARAQPCEAEERPRRSPLELFKEIFESTSPLAAFGESRKPSFLESVFGSLKKDDVKDDKSDAQAQQQGSHREVQRTCQETCTKSMRDDQRMAFIKQEYRSGDLSEDEYKELMSVFTSDQTSWDV